MVSDEKLIQQGIQLTEAFFKRFKKRILHDLSICDTYEEFLERTQDYTTNNILVGSGYSAQMESLITLALNDNRKMRASKRKLVEETIRNNVGNLITNVGEDIKTSVRDIVREGYDKGLHSKEIGKQITTNIDKINNTRASTIARTEVKRTRSIADYVMYKEMGATGFSVNCRPDCCPICARDYAGVTNPDYQSNYQIIQNLNQQLKRNPNREDKEEIKNKIDELNNSQDNITGSSDGHLIGGDIEFTMDQTDMLPPRHPNSYHKDTQVFTEHGWRYIRELTGDEKLLSLNPDDDSLEFIKPVRLFKHKEPELVHIHNKWFDICVTPDHDCFINQRRDGGKQGRYFEPQFRKPSELNSESNFIRCINTDRENPEYVNVNGLKFTPSDYAFFMAWYISEGSVLHNPETAKQRGYPIQISQEISSNREILEPRLKEICDKLGLRLWVGKSYFMIRSKQLHDYLLQLGYSHEKYIPDDLFKLNKECLRIFLDNYVLGDGHERKPNKYNSIEKSLYTSSVRLRDDLSYLILLCGYYPSISLNSPKGRIVEHRNGTYTQNYDVYTIRINKSKHTHFSACTVDYVDYDDYTYCVELPKWHTLWVMRNGKTSWNGNCRCSATFYK